MTHVFILKLVDIYYLPTYQRNKVLWRILILMQGDKFCTDIHISPKFVGESSSLNLFITRLKSFCFDNLG